MNAKNKQIKKKRVAWGITGAGDKIAEFMEVMKEIQQKYKDIVEIHVFLSKAAEIVLKYYRLEEELRQNFAKVTVELNSNTPFLAAWMQMHKYEFLLVAPTTSNTVAKIANGIGDTLLTNATIMSLKAFASVYIVPTDYREGTVYTKLPNDKEMKIRVRKEEADQARKLEHMDGVTLLKGPQEIPKIFKKWFG